MSYILYNVEERIETKQIELISFFLLQRHELNTSAISNDGCVGCHAFFFAFYRMDFAVAEHPIAHNKNAYFNHKYNDCTHLRHSL